MTPLAEIAAHFLAPAEREAVLGDLIEAGESSLRALHSILGLLVRRQIALWASWRPWTAAFALALPASFLLMGFSLYISTAIRDRALPVVPILLILTWSWTGGFVVSFLSRRTLWISAACSLAPCLFCLARFRAIALPRLCLLLFLAPALAGAWHGLRARRIPFPVALLVALCVSALMAASSNLGLLHCLLIWPAWYLVAAARPDWVTTRRGPSA